MTEFFHPMLATNVDLEQLRYPVLCSPKLDGIRCVKVGGKALARSLKPVPNAHVRELVESFLEDGMDGELVLADPTAPFNQVSSAVMSREGQPDVRFFLFDWCRASDRERPFALRWADAQDWYASASEPSKAFVRLVPQVLVRGEGALLQEHSENVQLGFEGTMIRSLTGRYKFGRSSVREQFLLKLKGFEDDEAAVVGFHPLMSNQNELGKDELGHAKRSSAKEGLVAQEMLGSLDVVMADGTEFNLGGGFTVAQRVELWRTREQLLSRLVTFKHQPPPGGRPEGTPPRCPVFKGFRDPKDL